MRNKILMTLALLITAVTGAWAGGLEGRTFVDFKIEFRDNPYTVTLPTNGELPNGVSVDNMNYNGGQHGVFGGTITVPVDGPVKFTIGACQYSQNEIGVKKDGEAFTTVNNQATCGESTGNFAKNVTYVYNGKAATLTFEFTGKTYIPYFFAEAVEESIEVTWDAKAKSGSFVMPAYDVEIAPIYAPTAVFATDGEPTAIEGIIAGEAKDIVKAGIVAKVGSTENAQGTLMYLVTTTKEQPTSTTGFSATVPTGAALTGSYTENQTVYVWYYIKGIDAAEGVTPTAENTFNDSEICETPLTVTVLSNKFDINFKAANDNTIEAGKATVTVGGTSATVTEGKLEGVKMGSEVKVTAKEGYKFRKVEVKKGAPTAPAKPEYADNAEELPANTKLYMRTDLVYNGDWTWSPTYTAEQAQAVANYYAAITGTKCAVIYGHGSGTDIYYVTSDNGVSGTVYRNNNLTDKFPGYKVYLLK